MHGLEIAYADQITFVRVNILRPDSAPLMEQFSFSATPEFYLVDQGGKIIGAWDDGVSEMDLRQAFDQAISQNKGVSGQ